MNKKMNLFAGKFVSAALAVMLLFYTALSVTSCVQPAGNKKDGNGFKSKSTQELLAELHGSWRSTYKEDYRINKKDSFFVSAGEDYQTHQPTVFYSGKIEKIVAVSETEGTIFIKFEKPGLGANKGEYYAIHYQRLEKEKKVGISGAYKAGGKSSTLTLQEAEKEFTVENGYFGVHSECTWHKLEEIAPVTVTLYEDEFGKIKRINPESSGNTFEVGKVYEFEAEIKNTEYEPDVWSITGGEFVENTGNKGDKKVKAKFTADGELKVTFKQKTPPVTEETVPEQYRGKWKATSSFYLFEEKSISVLKANSQVDTKGSLVSKSIEADGKSGWFVIKIEETTDGKYTVGHYIKIAFKEFTPAQMKIGRQRNSFATAEEAAKEATADVRIPYKKV